jgi:hypothetical protein
MKKFNLFNEIIVTDRSALMQAINSGREFGIDIDGAVVSEPADTDAILIYRGSMTPPQASALAPRQPMRLEALFGSDYRIVEDDDRILIKASGAWQQIIGYNVRHCDYDDTTADGVSHFPDEELESIGWHATEFGIDYRDLLELIESECEGVLLCIEQEEPYQFSGLGFISDMECARKRAFAYCKSRAETLLEEDEDYAPDRLSDDETEAAEFFEAL